VRSYGRGPSARRTGGTYTDVEAVEHLDDHEVGRAAADGDVLAGLDGGCSEDVVAGRGDDEVDARPVADGRDHLGRSAAARAGDDEVDVAQPGLSEAAEGGGFVGGAVEDQDGRPNVVGVGAPEMETPGHLDRVAGHAGPGHRCRHHHEGGGHGRDDERGGHAAAPPRPRTVGGARDDSEVAQAARDDSEVAQAAAGESMASGENESDREDAEGAPGVKLGERQAGGGVGDSGDPPQQGPGGEVEQGGNGRADEPGGNAGDKPPDHDRAGGRGREQVGRQ
jgi:hypothetical protein